MRTGCSSHERVERPGAGVFLSGASRGPATDPLRPVWALVLAVGIVIAVFLEVTARACVTRQRLASGFDASPESARAILDATAGLTRVVSVAISLFMALLVVPKAWRPGTGTGGAFGLGLAVLLGAIVWSVRSLKLVYRRLEQAGQLGGLAGWNGLTYNNPRDPRLWVPKLSGFGTTLNFAHARSWLILGAILTLPLTAVTFGLISALRR